MMQGGAAVLAAVGAVTVGRRVRRSQSGQADAQAMHTLAHTVGDLGRQVDELRARLTIAEQAAAAAKLHAATAEAEAAQWRTKAEALAREVTDLRGQVATMRTQIERLQAARVGSA